MPETFTQLTAPNRFVEAQDGVSYSYRRYGRTDTTALPLLLLQHYRGNLDNWDPALVDALAQHREVILVNNAGVGGSTGTPHSTVEAMAEGVVAFTNAIGLTRYDLLGLSLGGFVAQVVATIRPHQVRRLILAGTGPEGGRHMPGTTVWTDAVLRSMIIDEPGAEDLFTLFFESTDSSRAAGQAFIQRIFTRTEDRDELPDLAVREAQLTAVMRWSIADETRLARLAAITQPTLIANGDNDIVVPTENSHLLARHIPNARLIIYPDAAHGFLYQHHAEFAAEINAFLGN